MNLRFRTSALAVLVGAVLVLAGCSKSPVSPGGESSVRTPPPLATFDEEGNVAYVWAPVAEKAGDPLPTDIETPRAVKVSGEIDGDKGGMVTAGRFTVKVPPGAFSGPATVTISMPDSSLMICELSISPESANAFRVPVELAADMTSPGLADARDLTMYWYDPSGRTWDNLEQKCRVSGSCITAALEHFSKYGAGKAGW